MMTSLNQILQVELCRHMLIVIIITSTTSWNRRRRCAQLINTTPYNLKIIDDRTGAPTTSMRLKANGNTDLYNDLDMNGNDVEQVESVYFNSDNAGRIYYNGSLDTMGFYTNIALALTIESDCVLVSNSNHDMNNAYRIINCLGPTADQDVATKAYVDKTPKLIRRFHRINVSSSWKTFVCDTNDAGKNANYGFFAPYKVQINRMVFQFDGDTNHGNNVSMRFERHGLFYWEYEHHGAASRECRLGVMTACWRL